VKRRQRVLKLRPTQFAVGMLEVEEKIEMARDLDEEQLREFVEDNPIPVVVGPDKNLYIVDHHHFLSVCYHIGVKRVRIKIVRDLSKRRLSYAQFWKWMFKTRNAYPFCQFGEGPRKAIYLPKDIRGLADDPYRSLAWFVRKAGAFKNTEKNFAEFTWANFFRSRGLLDRDGMAGIPRALKRAVILAQSPEAKSLPGYGKLNLLDQVEAKKKVQRKGAKLAKR
jgi:hypothetical protein